MQAARPRRPWAEGECTAQRPRQRGLSRLDRFGNIDPFAPLEALGVDGVTRVQPISGGMDTLIWKVELSERAYALRLFRPDQRDQCSNEVRTMQVVAGLGVPVPRIKAHGVWKDRPAILMEWCDGRTVLDEVLAHPDLTEPLGVSTGWLQARMHAVSLPQEYWEDHRGWLLMAGPDELELIFRLREIGLRDGHLLHLDFHPLNVLCVGQDATVILDWANARVGDPRADVARTLSILRLVPDWVSGSSSGFDSVRTRLERAWMDGYTQLAGPLPDMVLFEIWAGVVFIRDMEQYINRPDFWMKPEDFDRVRDYVTTLKRQAGLSTK
jgi:Ser/Thr protein kinase RdoA (MazF antagonist)